MDLITAIHFNSIEAENFEEQTKDNEINEKSQNIKEIVTKREEGFKKTTILSKEIMDELKKSEQILTKYEKKQATVTTVSEKVNRFRFIRSDLTIGYDNS